VAKPRRHSRLRKPPDRSLLGKVEHDSIFTAVANKGHQAIVAGVCAAHRTVVAVDDEGIHDNSMWDQD
jgi:hypothetical protein